MARLEMQAENALMVNAGCWRREPPRQRQSRVNRSVIEPVKARVREAPHYRVPQAHASRLSGILDSTVIPLTSLTA